jgi:hypothetical protein
MGCFWHDVAHHATVMPHNIECFHMKILIVSIFASYGSSLMMPIKTQTSYKKLFFDVNERK